jgi:hypothetical protein
VDFTSVLKKALPWIGAAATGNVPALVMMAAKEVSDVLGVEVPPEPQAIATAVANATPEQLAAMRDREFTFQERMQALGFQHEHEMAAVELETDKAYLSDIADARQQHSNDKRVFWLGVAVLLTFLIDMGATFALVSGILTGGIKIEDVGIVAAVFGLLGTLNGYVAANAQQVIGYFFGSSRGSTEKTTAMSKAITQLGDAAKSSTPIP